MCVNPRLLNNGVSVACRRCWQCSENYINDWVGRCVAESRTAIASNSITLTYGRDASGSIDHERSAVLTYSDVQKWLKKLRFHGYPCRYFAVGEFGGAKGRAHWHVILFWLERVPPHLTAERFNGAYWDHGFSHWEEVNAQSIRYVCKYIQKDLRDAERQRQVSMSKYPPLGAGYFGSLARGYVEQGLSPVEPSYSFPDVKDRNGQIIKFWLKGASLDLFLQNFCSEWERRRGGHPPASDLLTDYWDRIAPPLHTLRVAPYNPGRGRPWLPSPGPMFFSHPHNAWACKSDGVTLFWSYNDEGERAWHEEIRTEAIAERMRAASDARKAYAPRAYLDASKGPTR